MLTNNQSMLDKALALAEAAHAGQLDKAGKPYILHPITVAAMVETVEEKTVALLHDVVEDTPVTLEELRQQGFSETIVTAVDALTKRPGLDYGDYIQRVKQSPLALVVKIADMTHNMDLSRIDHPTPKDYARIDKYSKVLRELKAIKQ